MQPVIPHKKRVKRVLDVDVPSQARGSGGLRALTERRLVRGQSVWINSKD